MIPFFVEKVLILKLFDINSTWILTKNKQISKAIRSSTFGRPGAVYIDMPAEMVTDEIDVDSVV